MYIHTGANHWMVRLGSAQTTSGEPRAVFRFPFPQLTAMFHHRPAEGAGRAPPHCSRLHPAFYLHTGVGDAYRLPDEKRESQFTPLKVIQLDGAATGKMFVRSYGALSMTRSAASDTLATSVRSPAPADDP